MKGRDPQFDQKIFNLEYSFNKGVDFQNRIIQLTEDIDEHHFEFFDAAMTALESEHRRKTIIVKINSYGGDVYTALGIIGRLLESPCHIHTKGYGKIMSASTAILASGNRRSMSRLAEFMHHECSYEVDGKHSVIVNEVKATEALTKRWCILMEELTSVPVAFWYKTGVGKDFYATAQRCLELNIIDEIF